MGVNGIGKSTIIHALACCFQPDDRNSKKSSGERYKFFNFFPPNTDSSWKDSYFTVSYNLIDGKKNVIRSGLTTYHKDYDRWAPKYSRQPICDLFFMGIRTCLPEIEEFKQQRVSYETTARNDQESQAILKEAAEVLNKPYTALTDNVVGEKKHYSGVGIEDLRYTSLTMGAGEQRVFRILQTVNFAPKHSLILIDEIDLLLHPVALVKLVRKLNDIALKKDLQIIFTTHSLVFNDERLMDLVDVKYLEPVGNSISVYEGIPSNAVSDMEGVNPKPIHIFVEDDFSQAIINRIALSLNIRSKIQIDMFGAASNAFTLAAAMVMKHENVNNTLIVLDGDVYRTNQEKQDQIKKYFSGTEKNSDENRKNALAIISQYSIPEGKQPEEFIHSCLCKCDEELEIVIEAKKIQAVDDNHKFVSELTDKLGDDRNIVNEITRLCSTTTEWENYVKPIEDWLMERKDI